MTVFVHCPHFRFTCAAFGTLSLCSVCVQCVNKADDSFGGEKNPVSLLALAWYYHALGPIVCGEGFKRPVCCFICATVCLFIQPHRWRAVAADCLCGLECEIKSSEMSPLHTAGKHSIDQHQNRHQNQYQNTTHAGLAGAPVGFRTGTRNNFLRL